MGLLSGCADRLLLYPSTGQIDTPGAERLVIEHRGRGIEVFVARPSTLAASEKPQGYVLEFCGNAARAEMVVPFVTDCWARHPIETWVINYPGFGRSDGPASLRAIPESALATFDELARRAEGRPIFVAGFSLGTAAALCVASQRPTAGMILQCPPPLQREILQQHGWWNLWLLAVPVALEIPHELNSLVTAQRVKAPAVFVLTCRDSIVPLEYQQMVANAYCGEKRIVRREACDHNTPICGDSMVCLQAEIDWLWEHGLVRASKAGCNQAARPSPCYLSTGLSGLNCVPNSWRRVWSFAREVPAGRRL
jgi:hypothetical protein